MRIKHIWLRLLAPLLLFYPAVAAAGRSFTNPLKGDITLNDIFANVINALLSGIAVFAVGGIIFGGFKYVTSFGDESKVGQGKKIILYSIVGLIIAILARLIMEFVGQILGVA